MVGMVGRWGGEMVGFGKGVGVVFCSLNIGIMKGCKGLGKGGSW